MYVYILSIYIYYLYIYYISNPFFIGPTITPDPPRSSPGLRAHASSSEVKAWRRCCTFRPRKEMGLTKGQRLGDVELTVYVYCLVVYTYIREYIYIYIHNLIEIGVYIYMCIYSTNKIMKENNL